MIIREVVIRPQFYFEICGLAQFIMVPVCHTSCCQVHKEILDFVDKASISQRRFMEQAFEGSNLIWSSWTFKRSKKPVWRAFVYLANSLALPGYAFPP